MRKKQIFLYLGIFFTAVLAMLGIAFGIHRAIRAGNLAGIDWYNTYDKEFVITTEEELYDLVTLSDYYDFAGQTIKLGADIVVNEGNAEDWKKEAPEKKWQPITEFAGTFDGQGHSISGLYGKSSSMSMGLFSETKETCVIKDFKLLNSFFTNSTNNGVGSILGEGAGKLEQIYSDAIIYGEGESNGGIAGLIKDELEITECWFDGTVIGEQRSNGGIIGWADRKADVTIDNCLNSGLIQFIGEGSAKTGGFIGGISDIAYRTDVSQVAITNSLTTGEIDVTNTSMAGVAIGTIRTIGALTFNNTYAVVEVTDDPVSETIFGSSNGKLTGNAIPRYRQNLIGVGGYQWTDLDFDKYWTCVEGDTPILKCFAEEELSLAGVEKKVDTSWYQEGQTEFVLEDAADLWGFAMLSANTNFEGVTIQLGADITINDSDKSTWKEKAPEYNWFPIYSFSGVFDGQNHTISGIYAYSNGKRIGLFQQVNANGSIANFKLVNSYIRGTYCIGAVVAHGGGNISNIYTDATVENTGEHTGGILGAMNQNGTISNCWFAGEVYGGTSYTGGITSATMATMNVVSHVLNTGTVYGGTKHSTGGLIGLVNNTLTLSDSLNAGKVDDTLSSNKNRTGSVIGRIMNEGVANITATYTTRESYETSIGQGYPTSGAPFVNSLAELTGNGGYQRTILNFDKYWAIDKDGHPMLQAFADEIPTLPANVKRPYVADISWYDDDETVFVITTPEQLYGFAQIAGKNDFEGKTVKLGKNISLNTGSAAGWGTSAPLNQWASIHGFNGTFDGAGHTISGLYVRDGLWRVGLFGSHTEKTTIKNVKVTNSYFEGAYHLGAIVGYLQESSVQGVYSDAHIVARKGHGGGLIGSVIESKVDNAWFNGTVTGDCNYIGGITSFVTLVDEEKNTGSVLSNCLNTGTITGASNVGGIVGRVAAKATIKYSLGAGTVTGAKNAGSIVGVVVNDDVTSCNLAEGVYATKESAKKTVGNGGGNGAVIVNTTAELTGVGGYQRTILDFNKYWSIVETSTPVLKKFAGSSPAIPNVARATAPDTSWYNAKKNTFVLTDYADLYGLAVLSGSNDFAGKTIKLGGNIVANSGNAEDFKTNTPLNQLVPISNFAGTFDGQGYTISGLAANNESAWYVGVIGKTAEGAVVKNVNVENSYLTGEYHIGSVVGQGTNVTIENVYSDAIMEASSGHVGGIIGTISDGSISNCWFNGSVTATKDYAGGITSFVGDGSTVTISHCLNTAPIKAVNQAAGIVGRVGNDAKLTLTDSLNTAVIKGMGASGSVVGRVMDTATVTLKDTYGTRESAGNLVGKGSYTGKTPLYYAYYLEDESAYTLTELDFDKYWVALDGETPVLQTFKDKSSATALSIKGVDRFDTSWYNADKKTFTINTRAELLGFAYLVNNGNDFAGKTVRLGKDIVFNDGDAADYAENAPLYKWTPIGSTANSASKTAIFKGTFNGEDAKGNRHVISGLCADLDKAWYVGLFGFTDGATIKNVEIKNSYLSGQHYVSSIAGWLGDSKVDTVYSDALINATSGSSGGIVGALSGGTITNTWYAGKLTIAEQFGGGIAGVSFDGDNVLSNCLNTGALVGNREKGNNYLGGLVGSVQKSITMIDCLSAGDTPVSVKAVGFVGSVTSKLAEKSKISRVYALQSIASFAIPSQPGNASSAPQVYADLSGYNGYIFTKLDFSEYWVAKSDTTPQLKSFASADNVLKVDTSFRVSKEWYDNATTDENGNAPGTEANPYILMDKADLYGFAELVNDGNTFAGQHVRLGDDIIVNRGTPEEWEEEAPDYEWVPIGSYAGHGKYTEAFMGIFDGSDPDSGEIHSISGLYTKKTGAANDVDSWCAALFGKVGEGAVVKNVKVLESYFEGLYYNGVVGHAKGATIQNIYSNAIVSATKGNSAGIVGLLNGGELSNCWFDGELTAGTGGYAGGLIGIAQGEVQVSDCLNTAEISSKGEYVGGFFGFIQESSDVATNVTLTDSLNVGSVTSEGAKSIGAAIGTIGKNAILTMEQASVHTIKTGSQYAIGSRFSGQIFNLDGTEVKDKSKLNNYIGFVTTTGTGVAGVGGYSTGLSFDNPETTEVEGAWVITYTTPVLAEFADMWDAKELRVNTAWASNPTKETIDGKEVNTYTITSKEELLGLAKLVNADARTFEGEIIYLGQSIDVNDGNAEEWAEGEKTSGLIPWTPIGNSDNTFKGTFDGCGNNISGIYLSDTTKETTGWRIGLFGCVENATITNVRLLNSVVQGGAYEGSFAGQATNTKFTNLYSKTIVNAIYSDGAPGEAGGIVGSLIGGEVTNCWNAGSVTSGKYGRTAGIVGAVSGNVTMSNCLNTGTVTSKGTLVGGFVGALNSGCVVKLSDSLNLGSVSSSETKSVAAAVGTVPKNTKLYVEKDNVHTVSSGLSYSIGTGFQGVMYDMKGTTITSGQNNYIAFVEVKDITGVAGYTGTGLSFDRPETTDIVEGAWVTTNSHPILGSFIDLFKDGEYVINTEMAGRFRTDTAWANMVTVEKDANENDVNTYVIDRPEELLGLAKLVNDGKSFAGEIIYLEKDIVVNKGSAEEWAQGTNVNGLKQWTAIGTSSNTFKGTFDGCGHSISGVYLSDTSKELTGWRIGLFGCVEDATITNVKLLNSLIQGGAYEGSFAGQATNTKFTNLYSKTIVNAIYSDSYAGEAGGIVGSLIGGEVTNCWNAGPVTSGAYGRTGGIIGVAYNNANVEGSSVTITSCLNTGVITSTGKLVGGFVGYLESGCHLKLRDSLNIGNVNCTQTANVGAAVGRVNSGRHLYVDQPSVKTVYGNMQYAIGTGFAGKLYDIEGNLVTSYNNYIQEVKVENITGANGVSTGLSFDNPETTEVVEGYWVTTDSYPVLRDFASLFSN